MFEDAADAHTARVIAASVKENRQAPERGWSQEQLAARAGVKASIIKRIEDGDIKNLDTKTLNKVTDALGLYLHISFEGFGSLPGEMEQLAQNPGSLVKPPFAADPYFFPWLKFRPVDYSREQFRPSPEAQAAVGEWLGHEKPDPRKLLQWLSGEESLGVDPVAEIADAIINSNIDPKIAAVRVFETMGIAVFRIMRKDQFWNKGDETAKKRLLELVGVFASGEAGRFILSPLLNEGEKKRYAASGVDTGLANKFALVCKSCDLNVDDPKRPFATYFKQDNLSHLTAEV
ncbi:MAG: helix-turn-helix domain-containing protein [Alphaproteobacteria bacterium]|nr:helix-turn-helix domain-containing protein [Alphaproteobacteria bacterium]